jgi:hypothetical protein
MKYQTFLLYAFLSLYALTGLVAAQQPTKPKRPVKNPPQFPNIIDLEGKEPAPAATPASQEKPAEAPAAPSPDAMTQALLSVASEMKTLTQELRSLNIRSQAQLDVLKMTRVDMRIDHYERELRPVRERLAALDAEEQTLYQLMTRESLQAQTAQAATFNRDELMRQLRMQHETRLRAVQAEKERVRKLEADLVQSLGIYQKLGADTEQSIRRAEESLRQIEGAQNAKGGGTEKKQQ